MMFGKIGYLKMNENLWTDEEIDLLKRLEKPLFSLNTTPEEALEYINKKHGSSFKSLREFNEFCGIKYYD